MKKSLPIPIALFLTLTIFLSPSQAQQSPAPSQQPPSAAPQAPPAAPKKPASPSPKSGQTPAKKAPAPFTLKTDKDKISYAIGTTEGKRLKQGITQSNIDVDTAIILRAIKDVLSDGNVLLTDQEVQATLTALQAEIGKKQQLLQQQAAENNKKESDAFLATNKTKDGVFALPSGLQYRVLQEGLGPKPGATDTVTVNYRGTLINGTEFDSSYKRNQPASFEVTGGVIKGWTEALQLMPVGSKWQVFIPSDLAYGPAGRRPVIGPNSALIFEIELLSTQPKNAPVPAPPAAAPPPTPSATPPATKP